MTIAKKEKKTFAKEFELIDLFPYLLSVTMVIGSLYLLRQFLEMFPNW